MRNDLISFYKHIGVKGLSNILDEQSNDAYEVFCKEKVDGKILDAGCGYGRLSIPLLNSGFDIEGIDIMSEFVEEANKRSESDRFKVGNLMRLDYPDNYFDTIICMWSTFNHFIDEDNQLKVLTEMKRVLKKGGKAIIDLPTPEVYETPSFMKIRTESPSKHICNYTVNNFHNSDYVHDENTLEKLMKQLGYHDYSIYRKLLAKLPRLILEFSN